MATGGFLGLGKRRAAANLVKVSENYLRASVKNLMYDSLEKVYEAVESTLTSFSEKVVDTQCELLDAFKELFDKFEQRQDFGSREEAFVRTLVEPEEFTHIFSQDKELAAGLDYRLALSRLLLDMLQSPGWTPGIGNTIVDNLNVFVTRQFQGVIYKSLDYYFNMIATARDISMDDFVSEKLTGLYDDAKVMFPINNIPGGQGIVFPPYAYLSVPSNAPHIRQLVRKMNASGRVNSVKYSKMNSRLYMLNLKIAVALYCYKELNEYEAVYEASLNKLPGLHLYESAEKDWKQLPSPNYDMLWTTDYDNPRERAASVKLRELFDLALQYKIIRLDTRARSYIVHFGHEEDMPRRFSHLETGIAGKTINAVQARAAMAELRDFTTSPAREEFSQPLFDTEFLADGVTPDVDYAKGVFIYTPMLVQHVAHEVYIRQYAQQLREYLVRIDLGEVKYNHFAQLLYMGMITQNRKSFRYTMDGIEHVLYTMQDVINPYVDYDVFQAYIDLDEDISAHLKKTAQETENRLTDAEYAAVVGVLDTLIAAYQEKLKQLESTFTEVHDVGLKRVFYTTMLDVFNKEKAVLA
jgi:hypothetical protein